MKQSRHPRIIALACVLHPRGAYKLGALVPVSSIAGTGQYLTHDERSSRTVFYRDELGFLDFWYETETGSPRKFPATRTEKQSRAIAINWAIHQVKGGRSNIEHFVRQALDKVTDNELAQRRNFVSMQVQRVVDELDQLEYELRVLSDALKSRR